MYGIIHARPYVVVSQHQIDTALRELQKMTEMIEQQRYDIARLRELLLLQRADDRDESTSDGKSSQPDT